MTALAPSSTLFPAPRLHRRRHPLRLLLVLVLLQAVAAAAGFAVVRYLHDDSRRDYLRSNGWPKTGQAAYSIDSGVAMTGSGQTPAPIASVAKVMTAYVVLRTAPMSTTGTGFRMRVTSADVTDTAVRTGRDESVVRVAAGEVLTERDALAALLLPSANNVAVMLARHVSGSVRAFVARMNTTARALGMSNTSYTDPSGYSATTVSTAADQLRLAGAAMREPVFANLVARTTYSLPVAGTVRNTDILLGRHGFVGIKTGSMDAAGGCFMFRAVRTVDGRPVTITGVVLGQPGHNLIRTGQYAALQLTDRIAAGRAPVA